MTTETEMLNDRLERLEQDNLRIRAENARFRTHFQTAQRRLRISTGLAFATLVGAIVVAPGSRSALAQGYGVTLQQLATRMNAAETNITALQGRSAALENKTQFMTADTNAKTTTFTACNVYVQNGLGATNGNPGDPLNANVAVTNGLGNLIIGYNSTANMSTQRGGSHNLVLGDRNNYTSYGGAVMGFDNMISGTYATVTGGAQNSASGANSSVSGGLTNTASGVNSSLSGGGQNTASGNYSSVNGGINNIASGFISTVGGGIGLTQSNQGGWSAGSLHSP